MHEVHDNGGLQLFDSAGADTRWMSYAELGQARGINPASAKRLALRRKWRRQAGNDGTARVAVPVREATPRNGNTGATGEDVAHLVTSLELALSELRTQLVRERNRADQASEAAERNAAWLAEAEARIATLRADGAMVKLVRDSLERALTAAERASAEADAALVMEQIARSKAEADAAALRHAEKARREQGRATRLRQAWRGG
jgi:hypothetical protein